MCECNELTVVFMNVFDDTAAVLRAAAVELDGSQGLIAARPPHTSIHHPTDTFSSSTAVFVFTSYIYTTILFYLLQQQQLGWGVFKLVHSMFKWSHAQRTPRIQFLFSQNIIFM